MRMAPNMSDSEFLTVAQVARLLGLSDTRAAAAAGTMFPAVRFGHRVRVPRVAFETWLRTLNEEALAAVVAPTVRQPAPTAQVAASERDDALTAA